ncbi:hypothetical protein [Paenibacillus sp. PL91]|nr:hypothetical protein [Paenibacillus sp. PL91]
MNTIQDWGATPRVENDVHRGKLKSCRDANRQDAGRSRLFNVNGG